MNTPYIKLSHFDTYKIDAKVLNRPSDRVPGCGTAQFDQTRTVTHNLRKFIKSRTIQKYLLAISIKTGISIEYQDF